MWVNSNFRRERGTIALIAAVKGESKEVFKLILKQVRKENSKASPKFLILSRVWTST